MLSEIEYELKAISDKICLKMENKAWKKAINNYMKLRETFINRNLKLQAVITLVSIASLQDKQGEPEKAGKTMLQAAREFESIKKMGYAYKAYQRALAFMESLNDKDMCRMIKEKIESLGMLDLVVVADSTGSMGSALGAIKKEIARMLYFLSEKIPGVRIGALTYRDHCDEESSYLLKCYPFTESQYYSELTSFIKEWTADGGGDIPEAVEDALSSLQDFQWVNVKKIAILIADAPPHDPSQCPKKLNWREESKKLASNEVKVYTIQIVKDSKTEKIFKEIANITQGEHFMLENTPDIPDLIVAIALSQVDLVEDFILDLESNGQLPKSMKELLQKFLR